MKIHEYQAKQLLQRFGVPVPGGRIATNAEQAYEIAKSLQTEAGQVVVVKAQIHAGGRGKGGGVKVCGSPEEARDRADEMLGMMLKTHQTGPEGVEVRKVLIETGVDIEVQPPGKRLQNMSLLSGGEMAMTAIALIFALFQVKPSPFCLLDEVDAPLDEANGARFNSLLREMAKLSQFIVITHNKKTMECVDTLYGVTMQQPGVSQLVTVRLD